MEDEEVQEKNRNVILKAKKIFKFIYGLVIYDCHCEYWNIFHTETNKKTKKTKPKFNG